MAFNKKKLQNFIDKYFNNPTNFETLFKNRNENNKQKSLSVENISNTNFLHKKRNPEKNILIKNIIPVIEKIDFCGMISDLSDYNLQERIQDAINAQTFSDYLLYLANLKKIDTVDIYKNANIDRKTFSKIKSDKNYHPKKITVLQLCIGLKLNLDEASDLLRHAGYSFNNASKTDVIFTFFIENKKYDIFAIDETLLKFEEPTITKY